MSELHNKKNSLKRKSKLNLIDVFLIALVVLAVGIFLSYRFFIAGDETQNVRLSYNIEVEDVGTQLCTEKLIGDELYTDKGIYLGKVSDCSEVMTKTHMVTSGEDAVFKDTVNFITVTVTCDAILTEDGRYIVNGVLLSLEKNYVLASEDFYLEGTCTEITEVTK